MSRDFRLFSNMKNSENNLLYMWEIKDNFHKVNFKYTGTVHVKTSESMC